MLGFDCHCGHRLGWYGHCKESGEVIVWVLVCLLLFDPVVDFNFVDSCEHSCSVEREFITADEMT